MIWIKFLYLYLKLYEFTFENVKTDLLDDGNCTRTAEYNFKRPKKFDKSTSSIGAMPLGTWMLNTVCSFEVIFCHFSSRAIWSTDSNRTPKSNKICKENTMKLADFICETVQFHFFTHQFWHRKVKIANLIEIVLEILHHSLSVASAFTQFNFDFFGLLRNYAISKKRCIFFLLIVA